MNNVLQTPVGVDDVIQSIQTTLYNELSLLWGGDIVGYGKVSYTPSYTKNDEPVFYTSAERAFPEWYNSEKQGYEDVFYDSDKSCIFSFIKGYEDRSVDGHVYVADVKVAFFVDLFRIFPGTTERNVSQAHLDVIKILQDNHFRRFDIKGIEERIEVVFDGFDTSKVRFDDMNGLHCFGVVLKLEYYLDNKCI